MVTALRKFATAVAAVAILATASSSYALPELNGSMSLAGFIVTQTGADLSVSSEVKAGLTLVSSPGLGDYAPVPVATNFGPHVLDLSSVAALAANFSLSAIGYGSFAADSAVIIQRTKSFLDVFFLGTFTPEGALAGFDPSPTSLRISVNQSGGSLSEAITLNSPPVTVPEPASLSLLGLGLAGAAVAIRRKRQA